MQTLNFVYLNISICLSKILIYVCIFINITHTTIIFDLYLSNITELAASNYCYNNILFILTNSNVCSNIK